MNETSDVLIACTIGDLSWLKRSLNVETNSNFIADTVRNSEVNNEYISYTLQLLKLVATSFLIRVSVRCTWQQRTVN